MNKYIGCYLVICCSLLHGNVKAMDHPDKGVIVPIIPNGAREQLADFEKATQRNHRAAVIAVDRDGGYALGMSYDCTSQAEAEVTALYLCKKSKEKYAVQGDAFLYAVDDEVVFYTEEARKWHAMNMQLENEQKSRQNKVDM